MKIKGWIYAVIAIVFVVSVVGYLLYNLHIAWSCHASGDVTVRGLFGFECMQSQCKVIK